MKKLLAILLTVSLILAFCSCKKSNDNVSSSSFNSEPTYSSELTETEPENISSSVAASEPTETVITDSIVENSSKEEPKDTSSEDEPPKEEPQEPIDFVPNRIKIWGSEETFIPYQSTVFYKGVKYASARGKSNNKECGAIVTVGDNDEYLKCIALFDFANNEYCDNFNICNDRIYYLQHEVNDKIGDYTLFNSFSVCSMNLSGKDKQIEKKIDVPYTNLDNVSDYLDSKYLIFTITNTTDRTNPYDVLYRYNTQTKEMVCLNKRLGSHKRVFSIQEKVFVYSDDDYAFFQYDINFNNEKLIFDMTGYSLKEFVINGFNIIKTATKTDYFLDLSGNISKK